MPFIAFFFVLAGAIAVFVIYPRLRVIAGTVMVLFSALLAYLWLGGAGEAVRDQTRIAATDLTLSDLELVEDARFLRFTGRVTNGAADAELRDFHVQITMRDCPAPQTPPADCAIIAQDTGIARVDVPAGQTRAFSAVINFVDMPEVIGVPVWDHSITAVRATDLP